MTAKTVAASGVFAGAEVATFVALTSSRPQNAQTIAALPTSAAQ